MNVLEQPNSYLSLCRRAFLAYSDLVLENFRLLRARQTVMLRRGWKIQALFGYLGLQDRHCLPRDTILQMCWPNSDIALACIAANSAWVKSNRPTHYVTP